MKLNNLYIIAMGALLACSSACSKSKTAEEIAAEEEAKARMARTIEFERITTQQTYRLVGSASDYFADSDRIYTDSISLVVPGKVYDKTIPKLRNAVISLAFDTVGNDLNGIINSYIANDLHQFGYKTQKVKTTDIQHADGYALVQGSVVHLTPDLLVYEVENSSYSPSAAHPMTTRYYINYMLNRDEVLSADALFVPSKQGKLAKLISQRAEEMSDVIGPTTIDSLPDRKNFYVNSLDQVAFVYQPYEVASYAQGLIVISFDAYELLDYFTPFGLDFFNLNDLN